MTVRWKPLVIVSGVFLVVGLIGVVAITLTMVPALAAGHPEAGPRRSRGWALRERRDLFQASASARAQERGDPRGIRRLFIATGPSSAGRQDGCPRRRAIDHLISAIKFDKAARGPRRELLREAMNEDLAEDAVFWAKDVLNVDAQNPDAHFVLAMNALVLRTPDVPEARRHLEILEKKKVAPIRLYLVRAKLAETTGDRAARQGVLAQARTVTLGPDSDPVDRLAGARIASLAVQDEADPIRLEAQVRAMLEQVKAISLADGLAPARVSRLRLLLEQTQKPLTQRRPRSTPRPRR